MTNRSDETKRSPQIEDLGVFSNDDDDAFSTDSRGGTAVSVTVVTSESVVVDSNDDGNEGITTEARSEQQQNASFLTLVESGRGPVDVHHDVFDEQDADERMELQAITTDSADPTQEHHGATQVQISSPTFRSILFRSQQQGEDEEQSSSTISTLETSTLGMDLDFGIKLENQDDSATTSELSRIVGNDEFSTLQGDMATLDWLNNQVAVAISNGVLPVTCKQLRGELYLDKFGSGNRGKCIKAYDQWFTPTEFEAFAGRAQCKDWKRSIRFHGRPLLQLIELDVLKVHAVSCTCSSCWNGESAGPIRLHDVKRKTSSFGVTNGKRPGGSGQSGMIQSDIDEPLLKQIRLEVQQQQRDDDSDRLRSRQQHNTTPMSVASSGNATIVRSPGGTLRLITQSTPPAVTTSNATVAAAVQSGQVLSGPNGQTFTLLIPQTPTKTTAGVVTQQQNSSPIKQQTMFVPMQGGRSSGGSGGGSQGTGIPLGLTYAPVQLVGQRQQSASVQQQSMPSTPSSSRGGVTIVSTELNEHWTNLEETVNNLQVQLNNVRNLILASKQKTDRALQDLWQQAQAKNEAEISRLRSALIRQQQQQVVTDHDFRPRKPTPKYCANCNKTATMECGRCRSAFYCSEFCVRKDAYNHRERCQQLPPKTVDTVDID